MRKTLQERLEEHPELKNHVEALLDIAEDINGTIRKADDAEIKVVENMRKLGHSLLSAWATHQEDRSSNELKQSNHEAIGHGKKSPLGNNLWSNRSCRSTFLGWPKIRSSFFKISRHSFERLSIIIRESNNIFWCRCFI